MSALTVPMIHSVNVSSGQSDLVNAEQVLAVTKNTVVPATGVNQRAKYEILFHLPQTVAGTPGQIVWSYDDDTTRDADYALVINTISAQVA